MTVVELSRLAATERQPPDGMPPPERCLYYALRDIYDTWKQGAITQEEGAVAKKRVLRLYDLDKRESEWHSKIMKNHAEMWKRIEYAARIYKSDRTLENADKFFAAVYGLKENDE